VRVDAGAASSDADPCDHASRVPATLAEVLRGVQIVREEGGGRIAPRLDRMRLLAIARASGVHLELFDEEGRSVLARDVPNPADGCPGTADGIALIIERYLRDLGYEPSPVPPLPVETSVTTSTSAGEPPRGTEARRTETPAARSPPRARTATATVSPIAWSFSLGGAFGGVFERPNEFERGGHANSAAATVDLRVRFAIEWLELVAEGSYTLPRTQRLTRKGPDGADVAVGTFRVQSLLPMIGVGACAELPIRALRICGGPKVGYELLRGQAQHAPGTITAISESRVWLHAVVFGAAVRVDVPIASWLSVSPHVGVLFRPTRETFRGDAETTTLYEPSSSSLTFGLAAWVRL
jgi:hypothetical protein